MKQFLETLKRAIRYPVSKKSVPCRCNGCYSGKQSRQGKSVNTALK